jgi:NAD(P)H-hydrate epimerase
VQQIPDQHDNSASTAQVPDVPADAVTWLSAKEMRAIDRVMTDELGIELKQMMENAGRSLAVLARLLLGGSAAERSIAVLAGRGGNGGGGLVAARHLANAGARMRVLIAAPRQELAAVTRDQLDVLDAMAVPIELEAAAVPRSDLVIDALLGYSQMGPPRGGVARLLDAVKGLRVLSLDVPSGLELTSGVLHSPHARAEATLTLAAPKTALRGAAVAPAVGELYLADISVPESAFSRIGRDYVTPFAEGPLVRIV